MDPNLLKGLESLPPVALNQTSRYFKGFLYGEYGVGKTIVSGQCVRKQGLTVYTDTGYESFFNPQHSALLDKIQGVPYDGLSQLTAIGQAITEGISPWSDNDLIIVDTISQIQEEYLDWLNDNYTFVGDHRAKALVRGGVAAAKQKGLSDQEVIGLPDYHLTRNNMRHPIKALIKAPVNVIFIAHLREPSFLEQQKGKITLRPTLTESVFKLIAREATWMGLMERKGSKRTIQFQTDTKKSVSKSRIAELDDKIIDAENLSDILLKWQNGNKL